MKLREGEKLPEFLRCVKEAARGRQGSQKCPFANTTRRRQERGSGPFDIRRDHDEPPHRPLTESLHRSGGLLGELTSWWRRRAQAAVSRDRFQAG